MIPFCAPPPYQKFNALWRWHVCFWGRPHTPDTGILPPIPEYTYCYGPSSFSSSSSSTTNHCTRWTKSIRVVAVFYSCAGGGVRNFRPALCCCSVCVRSVSREADKQVSTKEGTFRAERETGHHCTAGDPIPASAARSTRRTDRNTRELFMPPTIHTLSYTSLQGGQKVPIATGIVFVCNVERVLFPLSSFSQICL